MEESTSPEKVFSPELGARGETALPVELHDSQAIESARLASRDAPFGALLETALRAACDHRLSQVSWFRTDWQRGGALTGYATFDDGRGHHEVVVKLPVPPVERRWLRQLQSARDVVPHLYAHGDELGPYDLAWVVMERLPHGPLGAAWVGREFDLLIEAAGRFYAAASQVPVDREPAAKDWGHILEKTRRQLHKHSLQHEQRWKTALKLAHRKLDSWLSIWKQRPIDGWCHGDLHLGNAMTRHAPPLGPAVLIDFPQTRPGHWVEDAIYFEHLFWARRHRLHGRRLCSMLARERKKLGLSVDADWPRFASVQRCLLAMATPAMLNLEGDPQHVQAALEVLESESSGL